MTETPAVKSRIRGSSTKKAPETEAEVLPAGAGMKIVIDQPALARALNTVSRAVSTRPMIPVLSNIKLEAADGTLVLTASNITLTIRTTVECRVERAGVITLPASTLNAMVASFDKRNEISLDWDGAKTMITVIRSGKSVSKENGLPTGEFPEFPVLVDAQVIEIPAKEFCRTLRGVIYATDVNGQQEARPFLQGVTLTFESGALTMLGSDGFRVALARIANEIALDGVVELSVPAQSLREVERLFGSSESVLRLLVGKGSDARRVQFEGEGITVSSQVLDGTYWRGLKGTQEAANKSRAGMEKALQTFRTEIKASAETVKQVLRRARIFAQENNNHVRLIVSAEKGLEIIGRNKHGGETYDVVEAEVAGEDLEIGHNLNYLLDAIENLGEVETVRFCCNGGTQPMTIMDAGRTEIMSALSPMEESN